MIHLVIEGLDGTGKSTLAGQLHEAMLTDPAFCKWIYLTKEPGLTVKAMAGIEFNRSGVDLRAIVLNDRTLTPFERELLFYVDASQHRKFINDQKDAIIISDRGMWSHKAYLRATLKTGQIDHDLYYLGQRLITELCPRPDRIIYLRGTIELMNERLAGKKKDLIEQNGEDYFKSVLETYEDLSLNKCLILDAINSTSHNVETVLNWLKKEFNNEQLRTGTL